MLKAVEIREKTLPLNHPDLKSSKDDLEIIKSMLQIFFGRVGFNRPKILKIKILCSAKARTYENNHNF